MKLSEAIRDGAKLRPQGFCSMFGRMREDAFEGEYCSCANGAALEAIGLFTVESYLAAGTIEYRRVVEEYHKRFPCLSRKVKMPSEGYDSCGWDLYKCIQVLNDSLRWTREAIADWLEGLGY